jgi:hypothetical protein
MVMTGGYLVLTWYYFTKKESKSELPEGAGLFGVGFTQGSSGLQRDCIL